MQAYEPKQSTQCRAGEHTARPAGKNAPETGCEGTAYNARTNTTQQCACPCHKGNVRVKK